MAQLNGKKTLTIGASGGIDQAIVSRLQAEGAVVTDVVVFLASDQSRSICGALFEVNGGKPIQ